MGRKGSPHGWDENREQSAPNASALPASYSRAFNGSCDTGGAGSTAWERSRKLARTAEVLVRLLRLESILLAERKRGMLLLSRFGIHV